MKLKKVVSLALAGVMAVSMLAGCSTGAGTGDGNNATSTTSTIIDVVNDAQDQVAFTDNTTLDAALVKAVDLNSVNVDAIAKLTGIKEVKTTISKAANAGTADAKYIQGYFLAAGAAANNADVLKKVKDGDTYTMVAVQEVAGAMNLEAAQKLVATKVAELTEELDETTYDDGLFKDQKYFDYSYTGNVSMTSKVDAYGMTHYYVALVLNQTVAVKTVA